MASKKARHKDEVSEKDVAKRKPLPYLFEKELIEKQAKQFWIVDEFIPVAVARKIYTLEGKLGTKFEKEQPSRYNERFARYTELSSRTTQNGLPLLESQAYGWLPPILQHGDTKLREMNFIQAPKLRCEMTIYGEKFISKRITERPSFNGLRFFLR